MAWNGEVNLTAISRVLRPNDASRYGTLMAEVLAERQRAAAAPADTFGGGGGAAASPPMSTTKKVVIGGVVVGGLAAGAKLLGLW
jgi:hypothetical protein